MGLYNEQDNWVFLYDPEGAFRADINRIMYLSWHNKKGILLDYMDFLLEGNFYKIRDSSDFTISVKSMRNKIIRYGGKRMSELE